MESSNYYKGNLIESRGEDFKKGEIKNINLNKNWKLELKSRSLQGLYTSPIIKTEKFDGLIASWNADTPGNTSIEVSIQVRVKDNWTAWYSYGRWSSNKDSGSVENQKDRFAKMSIDTLEILSNQYADALRYRIKLRRKKETMGTPKVKSIYMALRAKEKEEYDFSRDIDYLIELDIPERGQMKIPDIGNRICSPTSLAMVLQYYGINMITEEVSSCVLDNTMDIYGNWSYNASFAGSKGLDSYVARFDSVNAIKEKIAEGIPVIASIKTNSASTLIGAPQTYPSGHLIVIRGFKIKNGEEYIIANDPASPEEEKVRREYKLSDFESAWSNVVYIISNGKSTYR